MAAPRGPEQSPEWLPSGFPPRTFPPGGAPVVPAAPVVGPDRPPGGGRGKWLAAAAGVIALLLLAAGLLLATRGGDGDGDELATGTSTSAPEASVAETTTTLDPTSTSIEPVSTTAAGATTTAASSPSSPAVLEPASATLAVPQADATAGPSRATLALRNRGGTALTYSTSSSSPALAATPVRGTIAPGASTDLTVTVDAARVNTEGPFAGTLSFTGTGGAKAVQVTSVVGRPPDIAGAGETCVQAAGPCSRQIKLVGAVTAESNPCNASWRYSVTISDQSRIQSAGVLARRGSANADTALARFGTTNIFQSDPLPPIGTGLSLSFTTGAVDEHGYGRRLGDETISC